MRLTIFSLIIFMFLPATGQENNNYEQLHEFFFLWRDFENPPLREGAPDYTKGQFNKRRRIFKSLEKKLAKIDTTDWTS